jgi:hypothetical protein
MQTCKHVNKSLNVPDTLTWNAEAEDRRVRHGGGGGFQRLVVPALFDAGATDNVIQKTRARHGVAMALGWPGWRQSKAHRSQVKEASRRREKSGSACRPVDLRHHRPQARKRGCVRWMSWSRSKGQGWTKLQVGMDIFYPS